MNRPPSASEAAQHTQAISKHLNWDLFVFNLKSLVLVCVWNLNDTSGSQGSF